MRSASSVGSFNDFMGYSKQVSELRHGGFLRTNISGLISLMRYRRIDRDSVNSPYFHRDTAENFESAYVWNRAEIGNASEIERITDDLEEYATKLKEGKGIQETLYRRRRGLVGKLKIFGRIRNGARY